MKAAEQDELILEMFNQLDSCLYDLQIARATMIQIQEIVVEQREKIAEVENDLYQYICQDLD